MEIFEFNSICRQSGPETIKIKGSKFISYAIPVNSQDKVADLTAQFRKKYYDSTHVCSAFRLVVDDKEYFRFSDDGEPSQTAGLPIFNEIKSFEYFNILVLVIRYYGGTKLGTGGLTRAYRESARKVLCVSVSKPFIKTVRYLLQLPYEHIGETMRLCKKLEIPILARNYTQTGIDLTIDIPKTQILKLDELKKNHLLKISQQ